MHTYNIRRLTSMTADDKLDLILKKLSTIEADINEVKKMQEITLDEVERVHGILDKHAKDTTKHTA